MQDPFVILFLLCSHTSTGTILTHFMLHYLMWCVHIRNMLLKIKRCQTPVLMRDSIFDRAKSTKLLKHPWPRKTTLKEKEPHSCTGSLWIRYLHHHCWWHKKNITHRQNPTWKQVGTDQINPLYTLCMTIYSMFCTDISIKSDRLKLVVWFILPCVVNWCSDGSDFHLWVSTV